MARVLASIWLLWSFAAFAQDEEAADAAESETTEERAEGQRVRRLGDSLAVDPNAEWVPSFDNSAASVDIIRRLAAGDQALEQGNLVTPENASALYYFQQVLQVEPGNVEARDGIGRVADALVSAARAAQAAGEREQALELVAQVQAFRPDYPGLRTLEDQLTRRAEVEALLAEAVSRVNAGQLDQPAGASAVDAFNAVLGIETGNADATQGLAAVRSALADQAAAAAEAGALDEAEALLARAGAVAGDDGALAAARNAIASARDAAREAALAAVEAQVAAGAIDAAEAALEDLLASGLPADQRTAAIDVEIARIRRLREFPAGSTFADDLAGGGQGPTMVVIPDGTFELGSGRGERGRSDNEGPTQDIRFAVPFALSRTEVTVAAFRLFVEDSGYETDAERNGNSTIYNVLAGSLKDESGTSWRNDFQGQSASDEDPVVHVSWNDARAYTEWLAAETGQPYRLPSESEFEYALKAGTDSPYWWGRGAPRQTVENLTGEDDRMAGRWEWPDPFERYGDDHWGPAPVGSFEANPFGLLDMGGNVMEWVEDCYVSRLDGVPLDGKPRGGDEGCNRVLKGGSWATPPARTRSSQRTSTSASRATCLVGFRIARDL